MAYTLDFEISLGSTKTGLVLAGQLVDSSGVAVGAEIAAGFTEIGTGTYLLTASIPDGHRGGIKIYVSGVPATILAFGSINPEEAEYLDVAVSTLSTLTAAQVWAYTSRTLTQAIASVVASLSGDGIAITIGDTWEHSVTGLSPNTDYVSIDFMVKKNKLDDDDDAIIWIRKNASGLTDGLLYLEGATPVSPVVAADGSITVDSSTGLTFNIAARADAELEKRDGLYYGVKYIFANSTQTVLTGICNIDYGIIHAIE